MQIREDAQVLRGPDLQARHAIFGQRLGGFAGRIHKLAYLGHGELGAQPACAQVKLCAVGSLQVHAVKGMRAQNAVWHEIVDLERGAATGGTGHGAQIARILPGQCGQGAVEAGGHAQTAPLRRRGAAQGRVGERRRQAGARDLATNRCNLPANAVADAVACQGLNPRQCWTHDLKQPLGRKGVKVLGLERTLCFDGQARQVEGHLGFEYFADLVPRRVHEHFLVFPHNFRTVARGTPVARVQVQPGNPVL